MKTKPTEVISLKQCKGVKSAEDETKKDFSFRIDLGNIVFYFHSETTEQKEKWIGVISKNLNPNSHALGKQMINPNTVT